MVRSLVMILGAAGRPGEEELEEPSAACTTATTADVSFVAASCERVL